MTWRDVILESVHPTYAPVLVVADPDALLRDEQLHLDITQRGYTLLPYDDPIAFRVAYEDLYAQPTGLPPLLVVLWDRERTLSSIPADILTRSVQRQISLADLFPRLHIPILAELDAERLDRLWPVYGQQRGPLLSAAATAEAVLQVGYGISLTALQTPADALHMLLMVHFAAHPLPAFLADVLLQQLRALPTVGTWPLESLLHDRSAFDAFLSRAWPRFLHDQGLLTAPDADQAEVNEYTATYHTAPMLPFDDPHVWPAIDTLFLAGRMQPVRLPLGWTVPEQYAIGVTFDTPSAPPVPPDKLASHLRDACPPPDAPAAAWLDFALPLGELLRRVSMSTADQAATETLALVQSRFTDWMQQRYAALVNTAPLPRPHLVSHVPHLLARERTQGHMRQALIVLDGLALDQWIVLRDTWAAQQRGFLWDERALFAWVPTLTTISRQAIFAGASPTQFATSLRRTDTEPTHWKRFWLDHGLHAHSIAYRKGLNGLDAQSGVRELADIDDMLSDPRIQVIGLVIDAVDKIAHGMQQGAVGMQQQVQQWAQNGWCADLITRLRDAGFRVTLTADHGTVAARGIGRPQDGILAEERGQRVRIYDDTALRDRVCAQIPSLVRWPGAGLPASLAVVLAPVGQAFVPTDQVIIAHGGIDLQEVLVPLCVLQ